MLWGFQSFFCRTEADFDALCESIRKHMVTPDQQALVAVQEEQQQLWTPLDDTAADALGATAMSCEKMSTLNGFFSCLVI